MHSQIPIILAFGAGLASTMALPTNSDSTLSKRGTAAWVASFPDSSCTGPADLRGKVPNIGGYMGQCTEFQFVVGDYIGVNYGGESAWPAVTFYSDSNCKNVSELNDWKTVTPGPSGMACIKPAPGTVVNSVAGNNDP